MPRSFLVKKIKADGFQCSGVPAPTYHPLETAYVLPGARGPPGDNGEWALGEGSGVPNLGHRREPQRRRPWSSAPPGLPEGLPGGAGARSYKGK